MIVLYLAYFSKIFEYFICQSSTNISLTFKDFLLTTFHLFNELVTTDIYPDEWATMRIIANEILLKTLQVLITYILLLLSSQLINMNTFENMFYSQFFWRKFFGLVTRLHFFFE